MSFGSSMEIREKEGARLEQREAQCELEQRNIILVDSYAYEKCSQGTHDTIDSLDPDQNHFGCTKTQTMYHSII